MYVRIGADHLLEAIGPRLFFKGKQWRSPALIEGDFLESLIRLAARAPGHEKKKWLRKHGLMSGVFHVR